MTRSLDTRTARASRISAWKTTGGESVNGGPSKSPTWHYILKNASTSASLAGLGVVSGLILDALILSTFGVGAETDALLTALTVPLLITSVFSVQGPKVLVPVFSDCFTRQDDATAWPLLSNLLTTSFCALLAVWFLGATLSAIIVPIQIPGLNPKTVALAVRLSRLMFGLVLCQGLASILQSVLYARHRYALCSAGKLLSNVPTIGVVMLYRDRLGIEAVAAGMLFGNFVLVVALAVAVSTHRFRYHWVLEPFDPRFREIVGSFRYPLVGHVVGESGLILQNVLGSFLGSGNLTMIRYASRIAQAIAGILLGSVVRVTFPLMATQAAANDLRAQRTTLLESIRLLTFVGLPICVWLILSAEPLTVLLFARGHFSRADAVLTAVLLRFLVPDILLGRLVSITQTLFNANMDLRTPVISTFIFTITQTVLAISLIGVLGVVGFPIAVSLASLSNAVYMLVKVQGRFGPVGWNAIRSFLVRLAATCAIAGMGFAVGAELATVRSVSHFAARVLDLVVPSAFGLCFFMTGALLFGLIDRRFVAALRRRTL